ncbi:MAG: 5-oxoprolinase subunit PxpA [Bacteroidota bacterium]
MKAYIDINCDMGESYGHFTVGNDEAIMPYISSCNLACGFHGGDPLTMMKSLELAQAHQVRIGAHPGFQDVAGFGRRFMQLQPDEFLSMLCYQVSALMGMAEYVGSKVHYIKAHGAMYAWVNHDENAAQIMLKVASTFDLAIMGKPHSLLHSLAETKDISFIREGFADRKYLHDGKLQKRSEEGAVLSSEHDIIEQVSRLLQEIPLQTADSASLKVEVDSICIHGDHSHSPRNARLIHNLLQELEIQLYKEE